MNDELNIVSLIEENPLTKLSKAYNNKLLNRIKDEFTSFEQKLFVSSFYCYLKYDKTTDFVVDLDNIWRWLGFTLKENAKRILLKNYKPNIDYKELCALSSKEHNDNNSDTEEIINNDEKKIKKEKHGGHNKITILMTINCFKEFCLNTQTSKAKEIHKYYLKLEDIMHKMVEEESNELRLQLEQKDQQIGKIIETTQKRKQRAVEQSIINQFPVNTECIYFGTIDNTNEKGEKLVKFGHTNDLNTRVLDHHKQYDNFILINAFRVQNKVEIENLIKTHDKIKRHIRSIEINGRNKTEILAYDATYFTLEKISKYIKDIIHSRTYSIDNFNALQKRNETLEEDIKVLQRRLSEANEMIEKREQEINELRERVERQDILLINYKKDPNEEESPEKMMFEEFIAKHCIVNPDLEVSGKDIQGQFRLIHRHPTKELFHAFKAFLDTRFKPVRLSIQDKNQVVHGYKGVMLKPIAYEKAKQDCHAQNFIFMSCGFSPASTVQIATLEQEYIEWKKEYNIDITGRESSELRTYLDKSMSKYVLYSTIWSTEGSGQGYYGLHLNRDQDHYKKTSSTGKRVEKRLIKDDIVLGTWETIAKAAEAENISASKMSRSIKNKTHINDYYYVSTQS